MVLPQQRFTATCPPNIDFEYGDFSNWSCFIGTNYILSGQNNLTLSASAPLPRRHVLQNTATLDPYGLFPVRPPLGGQYGLKLGNDSVGAQAERVRYIINVPANDPNYSITFQYAVVLENPDANQGGAHTDQEQPRFTAKFYDPQTNEYLPCGSFTFVASLVGIVPGFAVSSTMGGPWSVPPAKVWYKPWSSVYVDLSNYAGRTLYLEFTTADCTRRGHFGYAYVDVFACGVGAEATYSCGPPDTISLTAPEGFRLYKWYNNDFSILYGSTQQVAITPAPPGGGTFRVVVSPFNNSDCPTCDCSDTLSVTVSAPIVSGELLPPPRDTLCPGEKITLNATGGVRYQWYKNDVLVSGATRDTILASAPGSYAVDIFDENGCKLRAQRIVQLFNYLPPEPDLTTTPACINTPLLFQNNSFAATPTEYYWDFGDGSPIISDFQPTHSYSIAGSYAVKLIAQSTICLLLKDSITKTISIITPTPNQRYPTVNAIKNVAQNLTARPGASTYQWTPANGLNNPNIESPVFLYDRPQEYLIRVLANNGCVNIDTLLVRMFASYSIYVPNAFSPNGDGVNDRIYPILVGNIQLKNFRIFSRWGTLLFETNNPSPSMGWDGRWNNANQPMDTYTWTAEASTQSGELIKRSGNFVLIR
jgi:gliding motility-associated-like protein